MEIVIDQHFAEDNSLAALDIIVALRGPLQKTPAVNVSISIVQLDKAGLQLQSWIKRLLAGGTSPEFEEEEEEEEEEHDASKCVPPDDSEAAQCQPSDSPSVIKRIKNFVSPVPVSDTCALAQQVEDAVKALGSEAFELCDEGTGGAYFINGPDGDRIAIFKPHDEEPGSPSNPKTPVLSSSSSPDSPGRKGIRLGEAALRERAAFLLDRQGFFHVPFTTLAEVYFPDKSPSPSPSSAPLPSTSPLPFPSTKKVGSLQQFVPHLHSCMDIGVGNFPAHEVHKIGILDIQMFNTDRHGGNILVQKVPSSLDDFPSTAAAEAAEGDRSLRLIPIDHGYCLPDTLSEAWFDWLYWPQAKMPFDNATKEYVEQINVEQDVNMLQEELAIRPECLRTMKISTMLLKKGVRAGLTLFDLGSMICRKELDEPSLLERLCAEAETQTQTQDLEFFAALGKLLDKAIEQAMTRKQSNNSSSKK